MYIRQVHIGIPARTNTIEAYMEYYREQMGLDMPLQWLYQSYGQEPMVARERELVQEGADCRTIPMYRGTNSDFAVALSERWMLLGQRKVDVLCYCHETIENSDSMIPVLKVMRSLRLQRSFPFSVGQQGGLACLSALELIDAMMKVEGGADGLLLITDCVPPPFKRLSYGCPKGDAGVAVDLSIRDDESAMYEITDFGMLPGCLPRPMEQWTVKDYSDAVDLLVASMQSWLKREQDLEHCRWIIVPHISQLFLSHIDEVCAKNGMSLFKRERWRHINYMGSDSFVSLDELEQSNRLAMGESVCLLFAGLDHGLGWMKLTKRGLSKPILHVISG